MSEKIDWYTRQDELEAGMVFTSCWGTVKLDRRVPGDGTQWYALSLSADGRWVHDDIEVEPGELEDRLVELEERNYSTNSRRW